MFVCVFVGWLWLIVACVFDMCLVRCSALVVFHLCLCVLFVLATCGDVVLWLCCFVFVCFFLVLRCCFCCGLWRVCELCYVLLGVWCCGFVVPCFSGMGMVLFLMLCVCVVLWYCGVVVLWCCGVVVFLSVGVVVS